MDSLWMDCKDFNLFLRSSMYRPDLYNIDIIERRLKAFRHRLINLFLLPKKDGLDRQKVLAATKEGLRLRDDNSDDQKSITLDESYVRDALIISDVFDLNEILAVKLVILAQQTVVDYPDFPRGLIAVYLYYKNQSYLAESLKLLMQNIDGIRWTVQDHPESFRHLLTSFVRNLWNDGLLKNTLDTLAKFSLEKEIENLLQPQVKGLGDGRHRKMVVDTISQAHSDLADTIFYWFSQNPPGQLEFQSLIAVLKRLEPRPEDQSQPLNEISARLLFIALQVVDVSLSENVESEQALIAAVPFMKDVNTLKGFHDEMCDLSDWSDPELKSIISMAWSISLRMLSQNHFAQNVMSEFGEDEEDLIDRCLDESKPFHFLRSRILPLSSIFHDDLYRHRMHNFISQLIIYFPSKIKEWRLNAEQECNSMKSFAMAGRVPIFHFEQLMMFMGDFYSIESNADLSGEFFLKPNVNMTNAVQPRLGKFLKSCAESIQHYPLLYVAYLHMLSGLCNSEDSTGNCFSMLKDFAIAGSQLSALSLDNVFRSLNGYFQALSSSNYQFPGATYQTQLMATNIAPEELRGLQSWLQLLTRIALKSPISCLAMCQNVRWACMANCFGLVGCQVPLELKSMLLKFLAALASQKELGQMILTTLIASGIVGQKIGGLKQELEEVESKNETYPVTSGLVELLCALAKSGTLSQCSADPMIRSYFDFFINSILIHLPNRAHKNQVEKWALFACAAETMFNLVDKFDLFMMTGKVGDSLGGAMMSLMLTDGPVFRLVMNVIDGGVDLLDRFVPFNGFESASRTILFLLKLLLTVLEKQDSFLDAVRESINNSTITTSLDVLLRTINPKTGEPDYIVKILCYLSYNETMPEHCLVVSKLVALLNTIFPVRTRMLKYFCFKHKLSDRILSGFVNCLNLNEIEATLDDFDLMLFATDIPSNKTKAATALTILEFLIDCVRHDDQNDPSLDQSNIGLFLLGFDVKNTQKTAFQNPGINGTLKNCLHAVLNIVQAYESPSSLNLDRVPFGALIEPAFRLLYWLCARQRSSSPVLRYLRSNFDFVFNQVSQMADFSFGEKFKLTGQEIMGWVMKIAAIELKSLADLNQRSNINRILKVILDDQNLDETQQIQRTVDLNTTSFFNTSLNQSRIGRTKKGSTLSFLLHATRVEADFVTTPNLQYLDGNRLSQLVSTFTMINSKNFMQCDVVRLNELLSLEFLSLQGSSVAGRNHSFYEEIERVLESVAHYNKLQRMVYVKQHVFDAWRQLSEIALNTCSLDTYSIEQRISIVCSVLIDLLKLDQDESTSRCAASATLTLSSVLRRQFSVDVNFRDADAAGGDDSSLAAAPYASTLDGSFVRSGDVDVLRSLRHLAALTSAFDLLLGSLTKSENKRSPIARSLLYGALMNFLRLTSLPETKSRISSAPYPNVRERMIDDHRGILSNHVIDVVDLLCKDACDGPDICKTLALSCLASILGQNFCERKIISLLISRGYIGHQSAALVSEDDVQLSKDFTDPNADLKPLFVFLARMNFFTSITECDGGTSILVQSGAVNKLAECSCFSVLPDKILNDEIDDVTVSLASRYRRALDSVLQFLLSLLDNAGMGGATAASAAYRFLATNHDALVYILRGAETASSKTAQRAGFVRMKEKSDDVTLPQIDRLASLVALVFRRCDCFLADMKAEKQVASLGDSESELRREYFRKLTSNFNLDFFLNHSTV